LRLLFQSRRFSEDLEFSLTQPRNVHIGKAWETVPVLPHISAPSTQIINHLKILCQPPDVLLKRRAHAGYYCQSRRKHHRPAFGKEDSPPHRCRGFLGRRFRLEQIERRVGAGRQRQPAAAIFPCIAGDMRAGPLRWPTEPRPRSRHAGQQRLQNGEIGLEAYDTTPRLRLESL